MKILHPFMPFLTEEVWHTLKEREEGDDIIISRMPKVESYDKNMIQEFEIASDVINQIRKLRKEKSIPQKETLQLYYSSNGLNQGRLLLLL
jgi:valyl-tRNA synthetase